MQHSSIQFMLEIIGAKCQILDVLRGKKRLEEGEVLVKEIRAGIEIVKKDPISV